MSTDGKSEDRPPAPRKRQPARPKPTAAEASDTQEPVAEVKSRKTPATSAQKEKSESSVTVTESVIEESTVSSDSSESVPASTADSSPQQMNAAPEPTVVYPTAYAAEASTDFTPLRPPKRKGNRGAGILISLLATVVYAVVYAVVAAIIFLVNASAAQWLRIFGEFLSSPVFYVPIIVFGVALIIIVLIVNRAGWWAYVLGGFLVAVLVYAGAMLGAYVTVYGWSFSADQVLDSIRVLITDPLTLAAALVAREVSIWMGAWIGGRGRRIKARNLEQLEEYDRKMLAAAPVVNYARGLNQ